MSKIFAIIWNLYILLVTLLLIEQYNALFSVDGSQNIYYHILIAFDPWNQIYRWAAIFQVLTNIIHILPLFWLTFRQSIGSLRFWKAMFILRVVFDIFGHNYQLNELVGYFHADLKSSLYLVAILIFFWLPSYIVCYVHAFKHTKH